MTDEANEPPKTTACGIELPPALRVLVEYMEGKVDVFTSPPESQRWVASFSARYFEDDHVELNHRDEPETAEAALAKLETVAVRMAREMLDQYPTDDDATQPGDASSPRTAPEDED